MRVFHLISVGPNTLPRVSLAFALVLAGACEAEKSSSPLSPSVAGPIAGVEITAPRLLEPSQGIKIRDSQQPIRLVIENASSTGVRPLSYMFEVASDSAFTTKVFSRSGVQPGQGRTSVQLDKLESARTYYWRARAQDGANTGAFTSARFDILPRPFLGKPAPIEPVNNTRVAERRPTLRVRNADRNEAVGVLHYFFQISADQAFTQVVSQGTVGESPGATAWTADRDLAADSQQFWRARAADSEITGEWMPTQVFRSAPAAGGGGGGGGGGGAPSCRPYPNNGPAVVACVEAQYPQYLVAGVSVERRKANMAFLRDRIIETGICGGMNLAWNMKRGGPEKSIDFLAWHDGRQWIGVDIGRAYDDTDRKLDLVWSIYGPTPHSRTYEPRPTCN
jgi:hypothetical protein